MLIHSVTPIQMLLPQDDIKPYNVKECDGGYMEGYDTPTGFEMVRLCSTDPAMYLKKDCQPGSQILNKR